MKVLILRAFAGWVDGRPVKHEDGAIVDLPEGADWIKAGLAAPVDARTTADDPAPVARETATAPRTKRASRKSK